MDAATARALVGDGDGGTLDYTAGLTALRAHLAAQTRSPQETALIHWYERSLLRDEAASPCSSRARHRA
jgi:predicted kinase